MRRSGLALAIFLGTAAMAAVLYCCSAPETVPWGLGDPLAANRWWRALLRLIGGHVVLLAGTSAAVAAGLVATLVARHFGWRTGVAAALAWSTTPWVWNGVVLGRSSVCIAAAAVAAAWALDLVVLRVTRRARMLRMAIEEEDAAAPDAEEVEMAASRRRRNLARMVLVAGALFAAVAVGNHDWMLGRAAGDYARGVVEEASDRVIILNGVADAQVEEVVAWRSGGAADGAFRTISVNAGESVRTNLAAWVKRTWPSETNLWLAAQLGVETFARTAARHFPERLYVMTGASTTPERWAARWEALAAHHDSIDPFVSVMRRAFAFEGNTLGNRLQAKGRAKEAWKVYWRVFTEIEPENSAAVVNLDEMVRKGHEVDASTRERVAAARTELAKRTRSMLKTVEGTPMGPEHPLAMNSNRMIAFYNKGNLEQAADVARAILSRREGKGFRPAFAVLGADLARQGEYALSEVCYRVAVDGEISSELGPAIYNDYADTLRHLGRLAEAERYARLAVAESRGQSWLCQVTLAEVLRDAGKNPEEVKKLLETALRLVPSTMAAKIRQDFPEFGRISPSEE